MSEGRKWATESLLTSLTAVQMPLRTFLAFNPHSPDPLTLAAKGDFAYYIVKYGDTWAIHYEQFGVNTLDADLGDTYAVLGPRGEIGPSRLLLSGWSPPRTLVAAAELRYLLFRAQRLEVTLAKSDPHRKLIDEFIQAAGTEAERLLPGHKIEPHEYVFDAPGLNTFISTPTGSTTEIRPSAESREPFIAEE